MPFPGMLRRVALLGTDVSEESSTFIIRITRIGEPRTTSQKMAFFIVTAVKTSNLQIYIRFVFFLEKNVFDI
jgi:hypothetical protein